MLIPTEGDVMRSVSPKVLPKTYPNVVLCSLYSSSMIPKQLSPYFQPSGAVPNVVDGTEMFRGCPPKVDFGPTL